MQKEGIIMKLVKNGKIQLTAVAVLVVGIAAVIALSGGPAQSQKNGEDAWVHRCSEEDTSRCEIAQRLSETESGKRVVEFVITDTTGEDGRHRGLVILPLGVAVQTGLNLKVDDGQTYSFSVNHCLPNGCFALLNFPEELIKEMKRGNTATLNMRTFQGQAVNVDLSLTGFTKAFKKIS